MQSFTNSGEIYLHFRAKNYRDGLKYTNKKLGSLRAESGRIKSIQSALDETKLALMLNVKAKLKQPIDKNIIKNLSDLYSAFVFSNFNNISSTDQLQLQYDQAIVNRFQEMFKSSNLVQNSSLIASDGNSVDYFKYIPAKLDSWIVTKNKEIYIDEYKNIGKEMNTMMYNIKQRLGTNNQSYKSAADIYNRFLNLNQKIKTAQKNVKNIDYGPQGGKLLKNNQTLGNELEQLIQDYNQLNFSSNLSSTLSEQGQAGELVIAAINTYIEWMANGNTQNIIDNLLQSLNNKDAQSLNWTAKNQILGVNFKLDDKNFNKKHLAYLVQEENQKIDKINKQLEHLNKFKFGRDFDTVEQIKIDGSASTADVVISWPNLGLDNIGASIKNYRKGLGSKSIHILGGANLLAILDLMSTSYFAHFMHITSYSHTRKPKNKRDDGNPILLPGWKKMLDGLKLAALVRGLAGIRADDTANGGEAPLFILIDNSTRRVRVYDVYSLLVDALTSNTAQNAINLENSKPKGVNGKNILSVNLPLYKNEFIWPSKRKGLDPWLAARRRSTSYLFELHKQNLIVSASIDPAMLK